MEADPAQTLNVIEKHPNVVTEIRSAYDTWWKDTRPMMVNESAEMSPVKPYFELYDAQLKDGGIPEWEGSTVD